MKFPLYMILLAPVHAECVCDKENHMDCVDERKDLSNANLNEMEWPCCVTQLT
jgi:hypothetical protein